MNILKKPQVAMSSSFNPIPPGGGGGLLGPPTKIFNNSWTSAGITLIFGDFSQNLIKYLVI